MGMPHSNDLRLRALAAVDDGVPVRQVVALLRVSVSYIYKALIRRRRTGETAARMPCGRPPRKLAGHEQALLTRLGAEPDATLAELHDWLTGERGVTVSLGCLWRTLDRLGLRLKKVASCRRAEPARRGGGPRGLVGQPGALNPVRLIFLDETWIATNMMRRYGRSPRGERLVGAVPYGHWKTTTFVAGPRCDELTAPFVIDGPINGEWFRAYVEKVLAPTLRPGDIVILDNLGAHKVAGVRAAVEARGARLLDLPPYSPDLNPIEQLFAKLKALLRKAAARTVEALWTAVATLRTAFSTDECANYFATAGNRRSSRKRSGVPFPLHSSAAAHSHCGGIAKSLIGCLQRR
jgi:transposase